jgi:predicted RNase H-like nuclease
MLLRGVDGCPAGWLCVALDTDIGEVCGEIQTDSGRLLNCNGRADVVTAIDIPIGLPSAGPRPCDGPVRGLLGARASSVFPAPVRAALSADSYKAACDASAKACGKRLSKQTYAILPKIRDVDSALRGRSAQPSGVYEVHPELSFYFWNGRRPMRHPKTTGFGFLERYRLVEHAFRDAADRIRGTFERKAVSDDDILDAFAALWTAQRIHAGVAQRVPETEERDQCGLLMRMFA